MMRLTNAVKNDDPDKNYQPCHFFFANLDLVSRQFSWVIYKEGWWFHNIFKEEDNSNVHKGFAKE